MTYFFAHYTFPKIQKNSLVIDLAIVPMLLLPLAGASGSVEIKVYRERNAGEMGNSGVMEL